MVDFERSGSGGGGGTITRRHAPQDAPLILPPSHPPPLTVAIGVLAANFGIYFHTGQTVIW